MDAVKLRPYDLVFMDINMPEMDGLAATRAIRKLAGDTGNIPIIAMTANATAEDMNKCFQAGMNDFITKPMNREKLKDALQNVVDQIKLSH